jgi:hypothetical protein
VNKCSRSQIAEEGRVIEIEGIFCGGEGLVSDKVNASLCNIEERGWGFDVA